ncbi:MAG: KTSC domain-containing protein [Caulobacteraceae bacterium]
MPSTAIADIEYDPERKQLRITFVTGRIYIYEDVPIDVFEDLMSTSSRGAYFNRNIRSAYECRELR